MTKKYIRSIGAASLMVIISACALFGNTQSGSEDEFHVGIDSPAPGESIPKGPIEIVYFGSSSAGISKVELSINNEVVQNIDSGGAQNISVLKYLWTPTQAGNYFIRVRAQNKQGVWSAIEEVNVNVVESTLPTLAPSLTPQPTSAGQTAATSQPTLANKPEITPEPAIIYDVDTDVFSFYYGEDDCGPNEITITARVTEPDEVKGLIIFTRFADQESFEMSSWDSGQAMTQKSDETFIITLKANELDNYNKYEFATLFYQIVATDTGNDEIDRTVVFKDAHLEICPQPNTPPDVRFKNYSHNVDTFFYGTESCGENEITITTDVTRIDKLEYVILFVRFKDKTSDAISKWNVGGTMKKVDDNTHRITLQSEDIPNYSAYDYAAMSYQFVATDKDKKITGRSLVFDDISLERCWSK
jgi:hypothetical protein